jgi:hypothetical protein
MIKGIQQREVLRDKKLDDMARDQVMVVVVVVEVLRSWIAL